MKIKVLSIVFGLSLLLGFSINSFGQEASVKIPKPWHFNINAGQTLFWGDGNNDITNPFSAYFKADKSSFGYGIIAQKEITPWFGIDFQYLGGSLMGTRYTWSNGDVADLYFKSKLNQFGLNLDFDVLDLFLEPQELRLFNFYIRGGGAYNLYNATEYNLNTDAITNSHKGGAVEVIGGWGIRFDVSKSIGFTFENTFTYAFNDFLDAHSTQYSNANDIFAYTSIGMTYTVYPKPKRPSLEKEQEIIPDDTVVAAANTEEPKPELRVSASMNSQMEKFDTNTVRITINKYDLNEKARLQLTIPNGFKVSLLDQQTATYNYTDQIVSFNWESFPSVDERIILKLSLVSDNTPPGSYSIPGILFYDEDGNENMKQFKANFTVKKPIAVVAKVDPPKEIAVEKPKASEPKQTAAVEGLVYRVQVKAIYGGKSNTKSIARQYGLDKEVNEEFTKGYAKYTAGSFSTYAEAKAYKAKLRAGKVPDAFVVAYVNNDRVKNIKDAIKMESNGPAMPVETKTSGITEKGSSYSIQIAASERELSAGSLKNQFGLNDAVIKTSHNGLYKYVIGSYTSYQDAKAKLSEIRAKVSDAFIVKYVNGIRQ